MSVFILSLTFLSCVFAWARTHWNWLWILHQRLIMTHFLCRTLKKKEVTRFLKMKTIQKTGYLAVMKNNDVYTQIWKHSLNKLLRKKADDKYYKKWLEVYQKFNFSRSVIFIFDTLPTYVIWLFTIRVYDF